MFNNASNDYVYLREAFENHHHSVREDLNRNHPHAEGVLARYGVDLKKLRKRAATVVAAAAVAGLLLARPHGLGDPTQDQKQQVAHTQTASASETTKESSGKKEIKLVSQNQNSDSTTSDKDDSHGKKKGHRGHTRGRSYLAPPKEHGLHDLGLHKGDKNAPHPIKNVKGNKNINGIVITDKYEDMNPS